MIGAGLIGTTTLPSRTSRPRARTWGARALGVVALAVAVSTGVTGVAPAAPATAVAGRPVRDFDLQAHRGGLGLVVEGTLPAFANALELGVTTLEMDIQITEDGRDVVTHDRRINPAKCQDTRPAVPGDPDFPYAGKYIKDLTFDQVRTLDCGSLAQPNYPGQRTAPGARMPTLAEVFALVRQYRAWDVRFNIETKVEAAAPTETAPREQFVRVAAREVVRSGFLRNVTIQSFDWGALRLMRQVEPRLPLVALTQPEFLRGPNGTPSPWLGGLNIDDFGGNVVAAAKSIGVSALSPVHGNPQNGTVNDPDYQPFTTEEMVRQAHAVGMRVIPWTTDDPATMNKLIDDGVDGIITNYPDRLRTVMAERGFRLPRAYHRHHS
ncbi:glycerophosphodiester phosphodiesterase [Goodfellowiella coeruleoviolacea]|uniref:Glycerophosphoryl diester phosphodiesterase n=1 Tax=Goodfellowiella coeruleoviolacea TaxID=334858 RepID=A0AAE3GLJ8_9PSEU|nr:glycerophosphodiester phosphodiesterase [Goodfellowiella coeruleoviolacea]MCP2170461.1 glycerophosphoryl diester phosphodiesterase [Goodfellowiella coeruleoviolacea]